MKFTTSSATWMRGISAVQTAVGSAISNQILENIHVSCEDNLVSFLATNLSVTIRCDGEAEIEAPGSTVLPAKILVGLVQSLPNDDVVFEEKNENVSIKCAKFSAKLKGQDAALYPPFNQVDEGDELGMPVETLKSLIKRTIFATSQEKSRYELDGVKFELADGKLTCIATDGRRMAMYKASNEKWPKGPISILVPSKTLTTIQQSMPDEGEVTIRIQERKIQFSCGDVVIVSNLLVDNFPQYERILPSEGKFKTLINRSELMSAVKRAANLTSLETSMLVFKMDKGQIEVVGEREEVGGSGRDVVDCGYEGDPMEIRYNHRYVSDVLRALDEEKIELELTDSRKPGVFRSEGVDDYLYVLMPMRPPEDEEKKEE
ncbi:MAG: DNA polymerase III subunit beta [Candidatus Hinthialibacter antarcticus]|nr:DNA polymerase III subunit beta [Candidatus Hinthialibacter antarcticus]